MIKIHFENLMKIFDGKELESVQYIVKGGSINIISASEIQHYKVKHKKETLKLSTQEGFLTAILPDPLCKIIAGGSKATRSRLISWGTEDRCYENRKRYEAVYDWIRKNYGNDIFGDFLLRKQIASRWECILSYLEKEKWITHRGVNSIENKINELIELSFPMSQNQPYFINARLKQQVLEGCISDALAELTLMCCTTIYWYGSMADEWLFDLVLPPYSAGADSAALIKYDECVAENTKKALEILSKIKESLEYFRANGDKESARDCLKKCERILNMDPRPERVVLGEVYFVCYRIYSSGTVDLPKGMSTDFYLDQACACGYEEALTFKKTDNKKAVCWQPNRSEEGSAGICLLNTKGYLSELFCRTIPDKWEVEYAPSLSDDLRFGSAITDEESLPESRYTDWRSIFLKDDKIRVFLLDEDYEKNRQDFLALMQFFQDNGMVWEEDNALEIFIRGQEETTAPVVDTAISRVNLNMIPVTILDDDKIDAQVLLSRHPLFYPVTTVLDSQTAVLNFVIIGETECASWLFREALWMLGFRNEGIICKITLVSEHAYEFRRYLYNLCPMLREGSEVLESLRSNFPAIQAEEKKYGSPEFAKWISELNISDYYYFAVAKGDDRENLDIAMHIREAFIQHQVRAGIQHFDNQPVIAFHCKNPDLSILSKGLEVSLEAKGNQWYNHYQLIPFGAWSSRYTWDKIDGGIYEEMARGIHRQYCGVDETETDMSRIDSAMRSYFDRNYNRDSSLAVALFLPYRLFQARSQEIKRSDVRAIPVYWDIQDETVFTDPGNLAGLAKSLEQLNRYEKDWKVEFDALAVLEHERWNRYMVSRGWVSVTPQQMKNYIKGGNPRQQLYIAKMHPCICPASDIFDLQKFLEPLIGKKDFLSVDNGIVRKTSVFLRRSWMDVRESMKSEGYEDGKY